MTSGAMMAGSSSGAPAAAERADRARPGAITVLIASARPEPVAALRRCLATAEDLQLAAEPVADPRTLLAQLADCAPDVLLLDVAQLSLLAAESPLALDERLPTLKVLLLCDAVHADLLDTIVANHFHGYLLNDGAPEVCAKAIRSVHRGELWLSRAQLVEALYGRASRSKRAAATTTTSPAKPLSATGLTKRQIQVANYLRQGRTNKEIAELLGIKEDTVKKHLSHVFSKLGVRRRTQLMLLQSTLDPGAA